MNPTIIKDTTTQSMAGKMSFPDVVQALAKEGVESYQVDLVQNLKSFYLPSGEVVTERFSFEGPAIAEEFSQEKIIEAIRSIQAKKITYLEFLNLIMLAGCNIYTVYISGRKAIYFGRKGDLHVEEFPKT